MTKPTAAPSSTSTPLAAMGRNRSNNAFFYRSRPSSSILSRSEQGHRFQSVLQGIQSITRPNGEAPRSVLDILDDAIALETEFQRRTSSRYNDSNSSGCHAEEEDIVAMEDSPTKHDTTAHETDPRKQ